MFEKECVPYAPTLIESMRSIGYSFPSAIADLLDNSVSAHAKHINILTNPSSDPFLVILDDGDGMTKDKLYEAMRYGSRNPLVERATDDLGRFGLGLKAASLSQCRLLIVVSKCNNEINACAWDLDYVIQKGVWALQCFDEKELVNYDKLDKETHTVVTVHAKPELREVMNAKNINYKDFRYKYKINSGSLANALKGKNISLEYAQSMADILGVKMENVFFIEKTTKLYAAATIEKVKRATQCIFAMAKRQRLVEHNYAEADYISFGRRPKSSIKFLDDKQAKLFFSIVMNCEDIRIRTAFKIFLFTGMRRGEVAGLEWSDVDFENGTIHVCRTSNHSSTKGIYTKEPKTENSIRTMAISSMLIEQLREYRQWYIRNKENWGDKWIETDRIFTGEHGGPIDPNRFDAWLRKLKQNSGLPPFTVHSLRHTNITLQIAAGVPLTTVSGRAGHSRTSTTTDVYAHFIKTSDRQAADTLDDLFGKKDGD